MAIQTPQELLSRSAAVFQQGQNVENNENNKAVDSAAAALPLPTSVSQQRRCEERVDDQHMCSYEIREIIGGESVVIGEGGAFVVNRSKQGILLLMAFPLHAKQLIEVRISRFGWRRTISIFEPRWTKPRQVKPHGDLYLVGCRRKFGPCHYVSF
jgi:hypothetical protein